MPAVDPLRAVGRAGDALILARIWGGLVMILHVAGLAGALVSLFLRATYISGSRIAMTSVRLGHHIVALVAAVMLLIGLRSARFALLLTVARSALHIACLCCQFPHSLV
jgi:hypothetical protein